MESRGIFEAVLEHDMEETVGVFCRGRSGRGGAGRKISEETGNIVPFCGALPAIW